MMHDRRATRLRRLASGREAAGLFFALPLFVVLMMLRTGASIAALTLLTALPAHAASLAPKGLPSAIHIAAAWDTIGDRKESQVTVVIEDGHAKRGADDVPIALVQNLLTALDEPPMARPALANLGITSAWLAAQSNDALKAYDAGPPERTKQQEANFLAQFENLKNATQWMNEQNSGQMIRTDDYPEEDVELAWPDGSTYKLSSSSQSVFMIPWKTGPAQATNFNAGISRAIAALLPNDTLNRYRLGGESLAGQYTLWMLGNH